MTTDHHRRAQRVANMLRNGRTTGDVVAATWRAKLRDLPPDEADALVRDLVDAGFLSPLFVDESPDARRLIARYSTLSD